MTPPQVRDREATKEKILAAAFAEFTARGFAGARVDEIASRAGANKALLYQYYGDKEALFKHVLHCKMAELASLHTDTSRFAETVGDFFDFYAKNPHIARLMMWEALDFGTDPVPNEDERKNLLQQRVASIVEAQEAGVVDPDLDPRQTLFTLMSMIVFWFAAPPAARMICGGDPYSLDALAERRAHVVDAARRLVEVR